MNSWHFWTNCQKNKYIYLKSWVYRVRLSTHPYMMAICWSIGYFPSFSSALLPFLLLKTRLPGLTTEFPFLSPSLPSHLHQKQTCHHNPCVNTTSGTLYYHGPCMFLPCDLWGHPHSINRALSDAKNWTCLKRFSLFNKWLLFHRRLEESP